MGIWCLTHGHFYRADSKFFMGVSPHSLHTEKAVFATILVKKKNILFHAKVFDLKKLFLMNIYNACFPHYRASNWT